MRRAVPVLVAVLAVAGCKGGREGEVPGTWVSQRKLRLVVLDDKSFESIIGALSTKGTWAIEGNDVTFTSTSFNGKSNSEFRAAVTRNLPRQDARKLALVQMFLKDMDKPHVLTLSADGKTLTTNKAKDTNTGGWSTLTKS